MADPYIQTTSDSSDIGAKFHLAFNPFTAITRNKIYVPDWVTQWGRNTFQNNAQDKAALLWHSGILASTGLASIALIRALQAASDARVLERTNPQDKYKTMASTTDQALVREPTSKKANDQSVQQESAMLKGVAAWLPSAALIIGGLAGYNLVDRVADKQLNRRLSKQVQDTQQKLNDLVIARAQLARDNFQGQQLQRSLRVNKTASQDTDSKVRGPGTWLQHKVYNPLANIGSGISDFFTGLPDKAKNMYLGAQAALTLLAAATFAAGVGGGYMWSAKRNKARAQHKAAQKALTQVIRARGQEQTLDNEPISPEVVMRIQGTKQQDTKAKPAKARKKVQLPAGLSGAPVSIDI